MNSIIESNLSDTFEILYGKKPLNIEPLPAHGSDRTYFRLFGKNNFSVIGAHNKDKKENIAFLTFSKHFFKNKLPVPQIFAEDLEKGIYLEQDLGDITLFSYSSEIRESEGFSDKIISVYKKVMEKLPEFQITGGKNLDYSVCYPRHSFDKQSMMWDLNYFKYYFLKLAKIAFDEQEA